MNKEKTLFFLNSIVKNVTYQISKKKKQQPRKFGSFYLFKQ